MIRFAVCDDEPLLRRQLEEGIRRQMAGRPGGYTISSFADGNALLQSDDAFDILLLDIQMQAPNGMETARRLRQRGCQALLIFITVLKEYVFDAFAVEAYDYLLKPLDAGQFAKTLDRALTKLAKQKNLVIRTGGGCQVVPLAQLAYCEVQGRKLYLHRADGTTLTYYQKLRDLERQLDGCFFKCHRSYLVNLAYVRGCGDGQLTLASGATLPVSRLRAQALTQALLRYLKTESA